MHINHHVEELQRQLMSAAGAGGPETRATAERLALSLEAAARLAILEALSEAAGEITRDLAPGAVDVRLRGREVEFAVSKPSADEPVQALPVASPEAAASVSDEPDDASTSRVSLRLPEALKARAEATAAAEGISLNAWLVRAVTTALDPRPVARETRGSSYTGWLR